MLKHPNIITLLDQKQNKEDLFFIFEYCENGSLFDLIQKKGKLDLAIS